MLGKASEAADEGQLRKAERFGFLANKAGSRIGQNDATVLHVEDY
jgi:hypothetical protein